jgi:small nuclear ribonucleoprotein (snRNP)-like protein
MTKGLIGILQVLIGTVVSVELKSGAVVQGTLAAVDPSMTVHMTNVMVSQKGRESEKKDELTVRGATVRHFQLDAATNLDEVLVKADHMAKADALKKAGAKRPRA